MLFVSRSVLLGFGAMGLALIAMGLAFSGLGIRPMLDGGRDSWIGVFVVGPALILAGLTVCLGWDLP